MKKGGVLKVTNLKLRNSIFSRLVVTFLIIMIPIYTLGMYIYVWGLNTVKSEMSKSTTAQLSFYLEGLEKEIERIKILQYDCMNDKDLYKLTSMWEIMDQYDLNECMKRIQQRLATIKNSSMYIENVSVHILSFEKTISSNTGVDSLNIEKYQGIRASSDAKGAQIIDFKGGLFLSTFQKRTLHNYMPYYIIEIELNQEAFKKALAQFNTYEDSGSFLVNLTNNGIIINQSDVDNTLFTESTIGGLSKEKGKGMKFYEIDKKKYYIVHAKSDYLNMILIKYIPEEVVLKPLQNFYIWVWVFSVVAVFIILVYSLSTYNLIQRPLFKLMESFQKVEVGDLQVSIKHDLNDEFGYLYKRFNHMVKNLKKLIDQVYNQRILMQRAELKQLQSQINPHFLYNSFFTLNTMARIGDENLIVFTKHLGEYFRFITRNSSDYIPLIDEINHAKVYMEIQLVRFPSKLQIQFGECPERYNNLKVPRLILQPLIENAFEHGIEKKKSNGIVLVDFEANEKELEIIVEDNGIEMTDTGLEELRKLLESDKEDLEVTAIINIHRRVRLLFGEESGLQFYRSQLGGLKVILKIRMAGGEDNVQIADCG